MNHTVRVIDILIVIIRSLRSLIDELLIPLFVLQRGRNCIIEPTARFRGSHNITLGNNTLINHGCMLWATRNAKIKIGNDVLLGPGVKIFTADHGIRKGIKILKQPWRENDVVVGNDVWIGANTIILRGVSIGHGSVVGAGSVVTKSLGENGIYAGSPARLVRER